LAEGFEIKLFFPVEGESAIAELYYDGDNWADVHLEDVDLGGFGEQRTANARVVVELYRRRPRWRGGGCRPRLSDPEVQAELEAQLGGEPRYKWWWAYDAAEAVAKRVSRDCCWRFDYADSKAELDRAARRRGWWGFEVVEALEELGRARACLFENEHGRDPLAHEEGLTAAGRAFSKLSRQEQARLLGNVGDDETIVEEPIHCEDEQGPQKP